MTARAADIVLDQLTDIALAGSQIPPPAVWRASWAGHDASSLVPAWMAFRDAVRAREALATGQRHHTDLYDGAASAGEALDRKSAEIDDLYALIIRGPAGGAS